MNCNKYESINIFIKCIVWFCTWISASEVHTSSEPLVYTKAATTNEQYFRKVNEQHRNTTLTNSNSEDQQVICKSNDAFNDGWCCDRKSRAAWAQIFALWQQATIEFTCHDHSLGRLVIMFNRSHVNIGRASTPRSLYYYLFAPHISMVLFFTHIPFVGNHTINATPPERFQQWYSWIRMDSTRFLQNDWFLHCSVFRKMTVLNRILWDCSTFSSGSSDFTANISFSWLHTFNLYA